MEKTPEIKKFFGFHSEASMLQDFRLREEHPEIFTSMRENKYRASALPVSRRSLSHWRTLNIFDVYGDNPEQLKISRIVLFWLQIVAELRLFGFSLENIEKVKSQLFADKEEPLIETYFFLASSATELDLFLLVSHDAEVILGSKNEIDVGEMLGIIEKNYIKINLHILVNRMGTNKVEVIQQPIHSFLSHDEYSILALIRDGEYKAITLNFDNDKITRITKKSLEQNPDPIKELKKIIASEDDFCTITLQRTNGKFVSMTKDITEKT